MSIRRVLGGFSHAALIAFLLIITNGPLAAQGKDGDVHTDAAGCPQNPAACFGKVQIISHTFLADTVEPETGTYNYTIKLFNPNDVAVTVDATCQTSSPQLVCATINPATFGMDARDSETVIVGYSTRGLGTFWQKNRFQIDGSGGPWLDSLMAYGITVMGAPLTQHLNPQEGGSLSTSDTLKATYSHPSGINTASAKLFLNGKDSTVRMVKTSTGYTAPALHLEDGHYRWTSYVCATNGRCDSTSTNITAATGNTYALDDSLPTTGNPYNPNSRLLGPIAPPPDSLRGCAMSTGYPEIFFNNPVNYLNQSAPSGRVFVATFDTATNYVTVKTTSLAWIEYRSVTCSALTYLQPSQFNWSFFSALPPDDPHWLTYPWITLAPSRRPRPFDWMETPFELALGLTAHGPHRDLTPLLPRTGERRSPSADRVARPPHALARMSDNTRNAVVLPDPGPIDTTSYHLELNGTVLVNNSIPVGGSGVILVTLSRLIQEYKFPVTHPAFRTTASGGWNELLVSIADTGHRRTATRTRWAYDGSGSAGSVAALTVKSLRNFIQLDQGECGAFGPFQCDGVTLAYGIPGFVTRDRERGLHLIYRSGSQRAPTVVPLQLDIAKTQKAPDSLWAFASTDTLASRIRYAGALGTVTGPNASNINEFRDEQRIVASEVPALSTGGVGITKVIHWVRSWFKPGVGVTFRDDSVSQDVVQIYLSDQTTTRFGQGWQLAELGRLVFTGPSGGGLRFKNDTAAIWLSGDGSYTIFRKPATAWLSPPGETTRMVRLSSLQNGARYVLYLDNGASMGFRDDGWQIWTQDLVGNYTRFGYPTTTSNQLDTITDPAGKRIRFGYYTSGKRNGNVSRIWLQFSGSASDSATVAMFDYDTVTNPTIARLGKIKILRGGTAAETDSTRFTYFTGTSFGAYIDSVIDPRDTVSRRVVSRFSYDPALWNPKTLTRPLNGVAQVRLAWRRAAARNGYGRAGNPLERTVALVQYIGTSVPFAGTPMDYKVDPFGGPTLVRTIPGWASGASDDVRDIVRDTIGRPIRIVHNRYSPADADSLRYHYDVLGRVDSIFRNTLEFKSGGTRQLDTLSFTYDTIPLIANTSYCSRLRTSKDAMGSVTQVRYVTTGGSSSPGRCLVDSIIGPASDTTFFFYGTIAAGVVAGVRPVKVKDPTGEADSVAYHAGSWNSEYLVRQWDTAITRAYYDRFGRPDSIRDPVAAMSRFTRDRSGRVSFAGIGSGSLHPGTRTFYDHGGLVTRTDVGPVTAGEADTNLVTAGIQTTRNFFDQLGRLDSTITPGGRSVASDGYQARKQSWALRDGLGNPRWEFPGNGAFVSRIYDGEGHVMSAQLSQVRPSYSQDGERFADASTTTWYNSLALPTGKALNSGQTHRFTYDSKRRLASMVSQDPFLKDTFYVRHGYSYSRTDQLIRDVVTFRDGATAVRRYEYNGRGQRELAIDTVYASGITGQEVVGTLLYRYNNSTGRLDSIVGSTGAKRYASVMWVYDRAGRDTLQQLRLFSDVAGSPATYTIDTRTSYDLAGRVVATSTKNTNSGTYWYNLLSASYNKVGDLGGYNSTEPGTTTGSHTYQYSIDGTRRLTVATEGTSSNIYTYDVYGNRITQIANTACNGNTQTYGFQAGTRDNRLMIRTPTTVTAGCPKLRFFSDQLGNRIGEADTTWANPGTPPIGGLRSVTTYNAQNQLYFSLTPGGGDLSQNDFNWHWYDGQGRRAISQLTTRPTIYPYPHPDSVGGNRTYYVYDGNDVTMELVRSGATWKVDHRFLTGGLDRQLAGRFYIGGGFENYGFVADRAGSVRVAVRFDGTQSSNAAYFPRDAYGSLIGVTGSGGAQLGGVGYTGAGTPNARGGFVYLRNRWYDPQTGRFLTQDPIGLAGGVNLYAYAGNNPISFSDPYGLCPPCSDKDEAVQTPLIDPVAILAGGVAGGLRALGARLFGSAAADATATAVTAATATSVAEETTPTAVRFGQKAISSTFRGGEFAGKSVEGVAAGLKSGAVSANQLPINTVVRDGVTYTMNNRSLMALRMAGQAPTVIRNVTGNPTFERQLTQRLAEMGGKVAEDFVPTIRP